MALFLTGSTLTETIRRVMGGRNLRCAVAFWGAGAAQFLREASANLSKARILCDISMGATGPDALRELGAPDNDRLRRYDGLHAKVYVSDTGLVVGSPNASANGIGFANGEPVWLEAGSFHEANSPEWRDAISWFDPLYRNAEPIDNDALNEAQRKFRPRTAYLDLPVRDGSILDLVRAHPEQFGTIGFVFCNNRTTQDERKKARDNLRANAPTENGEKIDSLPDDGIYIGWKKSELRRWPSSFIGFFLSSRGNLTVSGGLVRYFEPITGSVFTKRNWRAIQEQLPRNSPKASIIADVDAKTAAAVLRRIDGGVLYSSAQMLSEKLVALHMDNSYPT